LNSLKQQGFYYGVLGYAFLIPFPQKVVTIALIIWVVLSLMGSSKSTFVNNKYLWLLPAFYVSYCIGFFTSETLSFQFLEYKLSLLIFPLLFFLHGYDENQRDGILKVFILGLLASAITCLVVAFYHSFSMENGAIAFRPNVLESKGFMESILYGGNYFFGRYLSIFHQTVYYAMYLSAGVAILLFRPHLFSAKIRMTILGVCIIMIFLVSNKASFIVLATIFALKLWNWHTSPSKKAIGVALFAGLLVLLTLMNPRTKKSLATIAEEQLQLKKEARFGFSTRLLSWDAAISLIKERPVLGYGHAAAQSVLNKRYEKKGYVSPLKESYNAHNLWLQSWLENGVLAVIILIGMFIMLFKKSQNRTLFLAFALILLINSMFEGLFNRFSGISFFSFLICLIFSNKKGGGISS